MELLSSIILLLHKTLVYVSHKQEVTSAAIPTCSADFHFPHFYSQGMVLQSDGAIFQGFSKNIKFSGCNIIVILECPGRSALALDAKIGNGFEP